MSKSIPHPRPLLGIEGVFIELSDFNFFLIIKNLIINNNIQEIINHQIAQYIQNHNKTKLNQIHTLNIGFRVFILEIILNSRVHCKKTF